MERAGCLLYHSRKLARKNCLNNCGAKLASEELTILKNGLKMVELADQGFGKGPATGCTALVPLQKGARIDPEAPLEKEVPSEKGTKFRRVKKESNGASKDSCGFHTMWNRHESKASSSKARAVLHAGAIKRPGQRVFKEPADLQAMKRLAALERQVGQLVWETARGQAGKKKKSKGKRREKPFQAWKHFLA